MFPETKWRETSELCWMTCLNVGDKPRNFTFQLVLQHIVAKQLTRFSFVEETASIAWLFKYSELFFFLL